MIQKGRLDTKRQRLLFILLVAMLMVVVFSAMAHADLTVVGTGTMAGVAGSYNLIYDSAQNITWLDYLAPVNTWQNQMAWAQNLAVNFKGQNVTGWSLPTAVDDGSYPNNFSFNGTTSYGYNNTSSQMGYLFYTDLGNKGYYDKNGNPQSGWGLTNTRPFKSLIALSTSGNSGYLSSTGDAARPDLEWVFGFTYGDQTMYYKTNASVALAVHPGNIVATTPPPPSSTTPVGYSPTWLIITLMSLTLAGGYLMRKRIAGN